MKNIYTILENIGVSIPEDKKAAFDTAFGENYKTVAELEKVRNARDNYKSQFETAQTALKEFEGVDVKDLQGKIEKLNNDLAAKDTEHQQKLAEIEFNGKIDTFLNKSGAKNSKAVKALLDLEALKASSNQDTDIQSAIDACKEENGFLFGADEPFGNPTHRTEGGGNNGGGALASMRAAMGLPLETK